MHNDAAAADFFFFFFFCVPENFHSEVLFAAQRAQVWSCPEQEERARLQGAGGQQIEHRLPALPDRRMDERVRDELDRGE